MSNKDLLKLENEYRNEIPLRREKPKIEAIKKPVKLTNKVAAFLEKTAQLDNNEANKEKSAGCDVEMNIYLTSM